MTCLVVDPLDRRAAARARLAGRRWFSSGIGSLRGSGDASRAHRLDRAAEALDHRLAQDRGVLVGEVVSPLEPGQLGRPQDLVDPRAPAARDDAVIAQHPALSGRAPCAARSSRSGGGSGHASGPSSPAPRRPRVLGAQDLHPHRLFGPGRERVRTVAPDARVGRARGVPDRQRRAVVTLAFGMRSGRSPRRGGTPTAAPPLPRVGQRWSPAVADIIGARRACTVAMISSVSMPCK